MIKTLAELCAPGRSICYGIVQPGRHVENGKPILRVKDLSGNRIEISDVLRVEETIEANYKRSRIRAGDVLVSLVGSMGQVAVAGPEVDGWNIARAVALVPVLDRHHADWVRFSLQSPKAQAFIQDHANTTVQATLNLRDLARLPISYPPVDTRREILGILGALDDKIELNRKTAATLEEMARALYRSWFVDFDPVHAKAEGHAPAHMSGATAALFPDSFGEDNLPLGWTTEPIIDQADWVNGAAYKNMHFGDAPDALPVVKIAELKAGITAGTKFTATDLGAKYRIARGDLLYSWSGNPDTSIDAFIWALGPAWLNQHIFAVRPNGKLSIGVLFVMLKHFNPDMAEIARNKQTTGLGHITRKDLEGFVVTIPSQGVMAAFEAAVEPLHQGYCQTLYESQTLATLRDALLPRLMSGELRVAEARERFEDVV